MEIKFSTIFNYARVHKLRTAAAVLFALLCLFIIITLLSLNPLPDDLSFDNYKLKKVRLLDRQNIPLVYTYDNKWNVNDYTSLNEMPDLLVRAFIAAEDKRFFKHNGVDWAARLNAVKINLTNLSVVRGASTITEQVVKMVNPRKRTYWSKWLEGIEAGRLEKKYSKHEILEFYLNEVPYGFRRRGVVQAARFYFDRSISTLNMKEMLTLAVLIRAPGRLGLYRDEGRDKKALGLAKVLADRMLNQDLMSDDEYSLFVKEEIVIKPSKMDFQAGHFVNYVYDKYDYDGYGDNNTLVTTLDSELQKSIQKILDQSIEHLIEKNVSDGAVLVVDHNKGEILAWVNGRDYFEEGRGSKIDMVLTPRQPGSTLKPFVYALAMDKGWTASTIVADTPLKRAVGSGLHSFRNYSNTYYGDLRLRVALANSLNIPAVRAVEYTGVEDFYEYLKGLGFSTFDKDPSHYGMGIALGNGEVSLFDLVGAYSILANRGLKQEIKAVQDNRPFENENSRVIDEGVSSILTNILSDNSSRGLEFSESAALRLPIDTAVKTGTSSDFRDAWIVAYNHKYTVGVWMGNLNLEPMDNVTGASAPAIVMRSIFSKLNQRGETKGLYLSRELSEKEICSVSGLVAGASCPKVSEYFISGTEPSGLCTIHRNTGSVKTVNSNDSTHYSLMQPTEGLYLAIDPRIPEDKEFFPFTIDKDFVREPESVTWYLNGKEISVTKGFEPYNWKPVRGEYRLYAKVKVGGQREFKTEEVSFFVK